MIHSHNGILCVLTEKDFQAILLSNKNESNNSICSMLPFIYEMKEIGNNKYIIIFIFICISTFQNNKKELKYVAICSRQSGNGIETG